ncbi:DISARM system helicase DrmA [Actinomadura gamaensis]|uniref:DISARM system helicase DrmA n=1 Tax=Actinomadura gamaensis TaxID=1763541 RepID=A0ABV9UBV9_9ACTN
MSERDNLVEELVAEVLGPRGGTDETMPSDEDPVDEYLAGVLAPVSAPSVEIDADQELMGRDAPESDDEGDVGDLPTGPGGMQAALPSLTLDPLARPASLGISVALDAADAPILDICCTWARYRRSSSGEWHRQPLGAVWREVDCSQERSLSVADDPSVELRVRARRSPAGAWKISLFLVNTTPSDGDRPATPDHVFQPQIRIRCPEGVGLLPLDRHRPTSDQEEAGLALLYADRPVLARGHLCSALWREVDPERPHPDGLKGARAPFVWSDGRRLFDTATVTEFEPSDARSEFVPVIPVNAPDKSWPQSAGEPPELDPNNLAELIDGELLRQKLTPLADAYDRWISGQEQLAVNPAPGTAEERHILSCRRALARIREGIDLLATDPDARLAFCFANRAIAIQSEWTKGRVNRWWPFQLAFQLLNLRSVVETDHPDRQVCDLLWFPTGGGKTEAYLGLAAFTLAFRRIRAKREQDPTGGVGSAVLSRYTLRLLTIQQYRRALAVVTACEFLRVSGPPGRRGWRPRSWAENDDLLWGGHRFSIGLWVGGKVTPNNLQDFSYPDANGRIITVRGAISILDGHDGDGDPAQVLDCPACRSTLAVPPQGLLEGAETTLHFVVGDADSETGAGLASLLSQGPFLVRSTSVTRHANPAYATVSVTFTVSTDVTPRQVDGWFEQHVRPLLGQWTWAVMARASRPGYFVRSVEWGRSEKAVDFDVFCPNPTCVLNNRLGWAEHNQLGEIPAPEAFARGDGISTRCPIPALTVDEQVYARCPSMVVATVDKFARLAFEPRAGTLFGNVDRLNEHLGYYREWAPSSGPSNGLPARGRQDPTAGRSVPVQRLRPPDLVLQDELHLIEGPLGSMVGLYEAGIDVLATAHEDGSPVRPKYIASTATVRQAEEQVRSLFARGLEIFPPPALRAEQSFFSATGPAHPLDSQEPGRLHVGVVAPGRGAQTPIVRVWSRLLQTPVERLRAGTPEKDLDPFWTLVGYFNAIRELAGAVALARQDILQRLGSISPTPRELNENDLMELSSRARSLELPSILADLAIPLTPAGRSPVDAAVATSMFGTGVDVDRLGLMVVHGQPKTTSSYIQATGRVGRSVGGLVVTFYRASRPRDLSHYEYFAGYHTTLYRHVEPVTVNPFAARARDRALGPVAVSILRQASELPGPAGPVPVSERWRIQQRLNGGWYCRAGEMQNARNDPEVNLIPELLEDRAAQQPPMRRPVPSDTANHVHSELDRWQQLASRAPDRLLFNESTVTRPATAPVVLGDLAHLVAGTGQAYENAPTSLREVEATVSVRGRS